MLVAVISCIFGAQSKKEGGAWGADRWALPTSPPDASGISQVFPHSVILNCVSFICLFHSLPAVHRGALWGFLVINLIWKQKLEIGMSGCAITTRMECVPKARWM